MKKKRVSLFDRALGDLKAVDVLLPSITDDVMLDICAYHCEQCIEKLIKFMIELSGHEYTETHDVNDLLEELNDAEITGLVTPVISSLNEWVASIRYSSSIRSSRSRINSVVEVCHNLVEIVNTKLPKNLV